MSGPSVTGDAPASRLASRLLSVVAVAVIATWLAGLVAARGDPVVRTADIGLRDWPAGAPPIRVALVSDLHLGSASTDVARLIRVTRAVTAARPDLILLAGDYIDGTKAWATPGLVAPLRLLRARLGVVAVLGNHDWGGGNPDQIRSTLAQAGITVLENEAVTRGPLAIGGLGDSSTEHDRAGPMLAALRSLPGARVVLTHNPDAAERLTPGLMLAGHTHCGQVTLPLVGPLVTGFADGERYACGLIRDRGRVVVVGAGIGTSNLPIRIGVPPDWWLLTLGPSAAAAVRTSRPASPRTPPR